MDTDAEWNAIFTWLKRRSPEFPFDSKNSSSSFQKPVLHQGTGFLGGTPKLDGIGSARSLHNHSLEKVAVQRPVSLLE
jgi:hypothetical protein